MKKCNRCQIEKELTDFYSEEKIGKGGVKYIYTRPDCKECVKEKAIIWAANNREKWLAKCIKYSSKPENKLKHVDAAKKYRDEGKQLEWQRNNPDKVKKASQKYSIKKHDVSQIEWDACRLYFNYRCAYCGITYEEHFAKNEQDLHKEHVNHLGSNKIDNCVPSCRSCNSSKGEKSMEVWFRGRKYFLEDRLIKIAMWISNDYSKI